MQKIALVTGASRGIGKGIADLLKTEEYTVIYSATRDFMEGEEYVKCDISNSADRDMLCQYIDNKYKRLDLLVNNAGVTCKERKDIFQTTEESFDRVMGINAKGTFSCARSLQIK